MKKVVFMILLGIILSISIYMFVDIRNKHIKLKEDNKNLVTEINEVKQNIKTKNENIENYENNISSLEEKNKSKLKEQNIWIKMKEKLMQALS